MLVLRWHDKDAAVGYVPFFTSLKIEGSGQLLAAIQRATRDARDFLVIDDGLAVLNDSDPSPYQRDIEAQPFPGWRGSSGVGARKPYTPPMWWLGGSSMESVSIWTSYRPRK